ncbi:MAG TPA: TAXI family TRAP transporter solute-binding subunit [Pseudolabrys sp.]|nr:TAXI family TRAP transporter solute-binding subunit [Pseudolabrys sp.]
MASLVAAALAVVLVVVGWPAAAQVIPKSLERQRSETATRTVKNEWTVGIVGGLFSGTYMRFAVELAQALDDENNLRVLPIVSFGAASNLDDLLYLRGVDVAITQSDVFEYFRTVRKIPDLNQRVNYIVRLPLSEVHILARDDIHDINDLRGKAVNLGPVGSASSLTGAIIFQRLGIPIKQANLGYPLAFKKLKSGEISALVRVVGKPVDALTRIPPGSGLHLISVPFSKKFADYYTLGELSHSDYPDLVPAGQQIDTIAVPAVLAVYDWSRKSDRFRRVKRFVERFFENWQKFQNPPYHPKWRDVNLAATVPGWKRFSVAESMLRRMKMTNAAGSPELKQAFEVFLDKKGQSNQASDKASRDALFREFMSWRLRHGESSH